MPGIDFQRLRAEISIQDVLRLLSFQPASRRGPQWYGPCPLHHTPSRRRREFSVNLALSRYYCHQCHSHGNQLELWAAFTGLPLYEAAIDLCHHLRRKVPRLHRR